DLRAHALDLRRAYENHLERRRLATFPQHALPNRTVGLAAIGIAANADVERAQPRLRWIRHLARQHDSSRAGAECGLEAHKFLQLLKTFFAQNFQERARFTARNHQAVDGIELLRLAHQHHLRPEVFEAAAVGFKISLNGEHTDFHAWLHD